VVRPVRDHQRAAAARAGIFWILFTTQTTVSVPAPTGAIMCMGVATANSVLVANFARQRYAKLGDPVRRGSKPASSGSGRC
jgi:multidrug efflux pump subunit AcrB